MKRVRCGSDTEQRHAAREAGEMEDQRPDHRPVRGLGVRRQGRKAGLTLVFTAGPRTGVQREVQMLCI